MSDLTCSACDKYTGFDTVEFHEACVCKTKPDRYYIPAWDSDGRWGASRMHINASHAVADDVMRELAEALRDMECECLWCKMPVYRGKCAAARASEKVLARFDALGGNDE